MRFWLIFSAGRTAGVLLFFFAVVAVPPPTVRAQLQFTEVMYEPGGDDALWEWVEIRNTSATAVDLNGWVFDDDDDNPVADEDGNIKAANGNTIVPAGGVAVLYPGSDLGFMPQRFTDAWGSGINLDSRGRIHFAHGDRRDRLVAEPGSSRGRCAAGHHRSAADVCQRRGVARLLRRLS